MRPGKANSLTRLCADAIGGALDATGFARRLWGDIYFNKATRTFGKKVNEASKRTFVEFILEPLYKLFSQVVGEDEAELKQVLDGLGIYLKASEYGMDVKPLLKIVLSKFFGDVSSFVDMLVKHVPSPNNAAKAKVHIVLMIFTPEIGPHSNL